jgi:hypothetical protein
MQINFNFKIMAAILMAAIYKTRINNRHIGARLIIIKLILYDFCATLKITVF